jgi:O-antigen/teichoic acid export membrane protein
LVSLDQAISSITNLVASLIAAHALPPAQFGAFGIVFATYMLVIFMVRSATGEVLLLAGEDRAEREAVTNLVISALAGLLAGAVIVAAAVPLGGAIGAALLPLGVGLAGLTVQDTIRYIGFSTRRVRLALISDVLWLVFMLALFAHGLWRPLAIGEVSALWVVSGAAAALCTLPFAGLDRPSAAKLKGWLREKSGLMLNLVADRGFVSASQQGVIYIIAALIGLEGNAAYRAAQIVMGPINVLAAGIMTATVPYLVRIWRDRPAELIAKASGIAIVTGVGFLVVTQVVASMPDSIGRPLIGRSWALGASVLPIMAIIVSVQAPNFAALGALRAMGSAGSALMVRILVVPLTLGTVAIAALSGSIAAVMWTQAGCIAIATLLWWVIALRIHRGALGEGARGRMAVPSPLSSDLAGPE